MPRPHSVFAELFCERGLIAATFAAHSVPYRNQRLALQASNTQACTAFRVPAELLCEVTRDCAARLALPFLHLTLWLRRLPTQA